MDDPARLASGEEDATAKTFVARRVPDHAMLDRVIVELQEIERRTGIDCTIAIGELILTRFFLGMLAICIEVGCGSKVSLAKIPNPHLSLNLPTVSGRVRLSVVSATEPYPDAQKCELVARDARATLNGVPLERERGRVASDDLAYNRDCIVEFTLAIASVPKRGEGATLQISDESATWTLELPTAFVPRTFTFKDPAQRAVKRGSEVSLRWSTPSDHLDPTWIAFEIQRAGSAPGTGFVARDIKIVGGELSFRIPPTTAPSSDWSGPALLRFLGTPGARPKLGPCPVASCSVTMQFDVPSLALTVEN